MPTYVALLRGINVGGKNLIKMPALRAAFEAEGFEDVRTYIASGNVIFTAPRTSSAELTERVEALLAESFDYIPTVVVRDRAQMRAVVDRAPAGFGSKPKEYRYDVMFLKPPLTAKAALAQVPMNPAVDTGHAGPGVLYYSRLEARISQTRLNRILDTPIYASLTIRNWNTTSKLASLMEEQA
jgi:uncharacterized protein (DUF1697 family)